MKCSTLIRRAVLAIGLSLIAGEFCTDKLQASQPPYQTMIDIGALTYESYNSIASAISADGSVITGIYSTYPTFDNHRVFIYTVADGKAVDIGTLSGGTADSYAISPNGLVIAGTSLLSNGDNHAFKYSVTDKQITDIGVLSGGNNSQALGASWSGSVIVGSSETNNGGTLRTHGFWYTETAGMVDIGTLPGGINSEAFAISANGSTVVGYSEYGPGSTATHAVKCIVATDQLIDINPLGDNSFAYGVSADGSVIVGSLRNSTTNIYHAFRYTDASGMVDIGTLNGGRSDAACVSSDGSVIAGSSEYDPIAHPDKYHAFNYTIAGGMVDLGTLGGTESQTWGISGDGRVTVGWSETSEGMTHAFIYRNIMVDVNNTYEALALNSSNLNSVLNLQYTGLLSLLDADCSTFGPNGLSFSLGGRYNHMLDGSGVNDGVGNMLLGYRFNEHIRAGVALDLSIGQSMPDNYRVLNTNPAVGVFASVVQDEDGSGANMRVSASGSCLSMNISRDVLSHTEAGIGSTDLEGNAVQGELSWGWKAREHWLVQPFAGLRYETVERKGYTEENSVEFPVSYNKTRLKTTTLFGGVKASGKVSEKAGIRIAAGVAHDISNTMDGTSGTIDVLGPFAFGAPKQDKTRLSGAIGGWYATGTNQQLGVDIGYRQQPLTNADELLVAVNWRVGL